MADRRKVVKVEFDGDSTGAEKAAGRTETALGRLGPIGDRISGIVGNVQTRLAGLGGMGDRLAGGLGKVTDGLASMGPAGGIAAAGVAAGIGAVTKFVGGAVAKWQELAQEVRTFQRVSGASADTSSRLVSVMDDLGISADAGSAAVSKLSRNVDSPKLAEFGVEVAKTRDGTVDLAGTLVNLATRYAELEDPTQRAELRIAALGKGGDALIPLLERGGQLKELMQEVARGELFSEDDLRKAEEFRLSIDRLGDATENIQRNAGRSIVPWATDAANGIAVVVEKVDEANPKLKEFASGGARALPVVGPMLQLGDALGLVGDNASEAADKEAEFRDEVTKATREAEEQTDALEDLLTAQESLIDSTLGLKGAELSLDEARVQFTQDTKALATATREHGATSQEAADAADKLERSFLSVQEAAVSLARQTAEQREQQALANGETFTAEQRTTAYKDALLEQAAKIGGPIGQSLRDLALLIKDVPENKQIAITTSGVEEARRQMQLLRAEIGAIAGLEVLAGLVPDVPSGVPKRALGGPVRKGSLYEVAEGGRSELLEMGGKQYLLPGADGTVVPATTAPSAGLGPATSSAAGEATTPLSLTFNANFPNYAGDSADLERALEVWFHKNAHIITSSVHTNLQRDMRRNGRRVLGTGRK